MLQCPTLAFATSPHHATCPNCWCYVCRVPALECQQWDETATAEYHCNATDQLPDWKAKREAANAARLLQQSGAQPSHAPAGTAPQARLYISVHESTCKEPRSAGLW